MTPEYLIIHTAAHGKNDEAYDTTAAQIDRWHKDRGWSGIGYHYVIRFDGTIEKGREDNEKGAHARGLNGKSLGICLSGHGDIAVPTVSQVSALVSLCANLCDRHGIDKARVLGHREIARAGAPDPRKTCPGKNVNMDKVRNTLHGTLVGWHSIWPSAWPSESIDNKERCAADIRRALRTLYSTLPMVGCESALDELNALRRDPSLNALLEEIDE